MACPLKVGEVFKLASGIELEFMGKQGDCLYAMHRKTKILWCKIDLNLEPWGVSKEWSPLSK